MQGAETDAGKNDPRRFLINADALELASSASSESDEGSESPTSGALATLDTDAVLETAAPKKDPTKTSPVPVPARLSRAERAERAEQARADAILSANGEAERTKKVDAERKKKAPAA